MKSCEDLRAKLDFGDNKKFYWRQIIDKISRGWKEMFIEYGGNISNLIINDYNLIKNIRSIAYES